MQPRIREIIRERVICLNLVEGINAEQKLFYAFIALNGVNSDRLKAINSPIVLGDYGTILYSDFGEDIPDYIFDAVVSGFKIRYLINT